MNYLTELLAFFRWMEQQRLSPLLQAFWHYLMSVSYTHLV